MSKSLVSLAIALIAATAWTARSAHAQTIHKIRITGDRVGDGVVAPEVVYRFDEERAVSPVLNHAADIAFTTKMRGPGINAGNDAGLWVIDFGHNAARQVARSGTTAPGLLNATFKEFKDPVRLRGNRVAFRALYEAPGPAMDREGIWVESVPGTLNLVAHLGQMAPGAPPAATYRGFGHPSPSNPHFVQRYDTSFVLGAEGLVSFFSSLSPTGSDDAGIFGKDQNGETLRLVRKGARAPGIADPDPKFANAVFRELDDPVVVDANAGVVGSPNGIFGATVNTVPPGGAVEVWPRLGIWIADPTDVKALVTRGEPAPQIPGATSFVSFGTFDCNQARGLSFGAQLRGPGIHVNNDSGIWATRGPPVQRALVAREGDTAGVPGNPAAVFASLEFAPHTMNAAGRVAFHAIMKGGGVTVANDGGVWLDTGTPATIILVAREGDVAPGTNDGARFFRFDVPVLNRAGSVAVGADLRGAGVAGTKDRGLWVWTFSGELQLIARKGTAFQVGPGDMRTVKDVRFAGPSGGEDGRPTSFGMRPDGTQFITFGLSFTDGTGGIFEATPL